MSDELKKKLYDYEVSPPIAAWDKIAAALDEQVSAEFSKKLYNLEAVPQNNVWDKIAKELETEEQEKYSLKLYNLEIDPPAKAWEKISVALDEKNNLLQIPSKRKIIPFIKYAAAACVIGIIAFGAIKLLNEKTSTHAVASKTVLPQKNSSSDQPADQKKSLV